MKREKSPMNLSITTAAYWKSNRLTEKGGEHRAPLIIVSSYNGLN
ncbi:hypothetical protein SAMN04488513_10311 [Pseudozobellia thermophila]|uniref:Uncharacterized protein n=1 Tax=Pseudozobellia thermophila TaxID=192903 RepID=A0A1M6HDP5_9FLAO|nr:hypothetical protein SAMN04488513_10311 [Pseudozobellia thermophila]